jgi:phosphatidylglycerophosphatase A
MKNFVIKFLATGAYTGYSPVMPGTFGTLWGVVIAYLISGAGVPLQALIILAVTAASIYVAGEAATLFGEKDPSRVTCDEVSGLLFAFFLVPFTPLNAILVFLLFRFFDILKPYPVSMLDSRVEGGLGIVADDCAAGIYANISVQIILWFLA